MEDSESVEMSGPEPVQGVAAAWDSVSAALVSGPEPRTSVSESNHE